MLKQGEAGLTTAKLCRQHGITEQTYYRRILSRHELLMVVREAIYNAVRHGRSSKVQVEVGFDTARCDVKIRDNGTGFDPESVSSLPAGHYGLVGMRERIARVGGTLTLNSRPGGGAEVTFHIPRGSLVPSDDMEVKL